MDAAAALAALEAAGTAQNRKVYGRHGAPEPMFGVSWAVLRTMAKQIGRDHQLAGALWDSGNTDARLLAMMVADPAALDVATADRWAGGCRYHGVCDQVGQLVAESPLALDRMSQWIGSDDEYVARCGWAVMQHLAVHQPEVPDASFTPYLSVIERRIHDAPNRAKEGMNRALIAIGSRSRELMAPAIAAAGRIGPVEIDHGETGCETFDAVAYIKKARAHAEGKAKQKKPAPKPKKKTKAKDAPKKAAPKAKAKAAPKAKPKKRR